MTRPGLAGILIRHAHKPPDGNARCGLSPLGAEQVTLYREMISEAMTTLLNGDSSVFASSNTDRNIDTLEGLFPSRLSARIERPEELDLPFLGEHDEDLTACRELCAELNGKLEPDQPPFTPNQVFARLEEFGRIRVGETPARSEARIRGWMIEAARNNRLFIYSMNSPVGNRALQVGVDEALTELEVLFVGFDADTETFTLLGRIAPEWEDVAD